MMQILFAKAHVKDYRRGDGTPVRAYDRRDQPKTIAQRIKRFVGGALSSNDLKGECTFAWVTDAEAAMVAAAGGPDVRGMPHVLSADSIRHALESHSDPDVEADYGQRPLDVDDLSWIPLIVNRPHRVRAKARKSDGQWSITYTRRFGYVTLEYVVSVIASSRKNKPRLVMRTAWAKVHAPVRVESDLTPVYAPERKATVTPRAPTVNVMAQAIAKVGEQQFRNLVRQHLEQFAGEDLEPAEVAAETEGVARLIIAGAYDLRKALLLKAGATPAQLRAGNYPKRKVPWHGLTLSIENERGTVRSGVGPKGPWAVQMKHAYGYILRTEGVDGDHVDCFVGPDLGAGYVYVVHARKAGKFIDYDEDKCMLGFASKQAALQAFMDNYSDPRFLGEVSVLTVPEFVDKVRATWTARGRDRKVSP